MDVQTIVAGALDLAGGELIREKLDAHLGVLAAMNVFDTMMLELANSGKQISGYKSTISVPAGTTTGSFTSNTYLLDTKFVRYRTSDTDRWQIVDVVDDIEELTEKENRGKRAICFQGKSSPVTYFLSWTPDTAITLEVWGRSSGITSGAHATGSVSVVIQGRAATGKLTVLSGVRAATGRLHVTGGTVSATGNLTLRQGLRAVGFLMVDATPTNGETVIINGVTFTFRSPETASEEDPFQFIYSSDTIETAVNMMQVLNACPHSSISRATYSSLKNQVNISHDTIGTGGNAFTLANSSGGYVTRGSAMLTGGINGVVNGETLAVNGVVFTFYSTAFLPAEAENAVVVNDSAGITASNLAAALNASTVANVALADYRAAGNVVYVTHAERGYVGNTFALANSNLGAVTRSASTLTGGVGGIVEGETIAINGVTYTFSNFLFDDLYIPFGSSPVINALNIAAALNASQNPAINVATYSLPNVDVPGFCDIDIIYDTPGVGGNAFTLANSSNGSITRSGATLTGGADSGITEGETININGVVYTFDNDSGALNIPFAGDAANNATQIATKLNASVDSRLTVATYTAVANEVQIQYDTIGSAGNGFNLNNSSLMSVQRSASTLTGGTGDIAEGETLNVNGYIFIFSNLAEGPEYIIFSTNAEQTAVNMAGVFNASTDERVNVATYTAAGITVNIRFDTVGVAGNRFTLANSNRGTVVASGAFLTGGVDGQGTEITSLAGLPPFPPEFSLLATYRTADFILNQLLIIDGKTYRDFVGAQKMSLERERVRCEFIWKSFRFMPADAYASSHIRGFNFLDHEDGENEHV